MKTYTEGCLICGKPIVYYPELKQLTCLICGAECSTNASGECGHFVCDSCHADRGLIYITNAVSDTDSKSPISLATEIMQNDFINMHGPEHHYLIVAVLLAAYKNAGGQVDFEKGLNFAKQRAKNVPGGICGMWGTCGAGVATGIFVSIITGASPLSELEWSMANKMTSESLLLISQNGGPRCCKRNTYLAISQASKYVKERFGISMQMPESISCHFSHRNKQCKHEKCLFFIS